MFKKISFMFLLAIAAMAACTEDAPAPKFTLDTNTVTLTSGEAGSSNVLLSSNVDLTASVEADAASWLSAEVTRRSLTLTYTLNDTGAERSANVIVSAGNLQQTVTLVQPSYVQPKVGYEVGDVVEDGKGMIYWVDASDSKIAKAVSLTRVKGKLWSTDAVAAGADKFVNGPANMELLNNEKYEAAAFCSAMGEGWYLPARDELVELFEIYNGKLATETTIAKPEAISDEEKTARAAFDAMLVGASAEAMNTAGDASNGDAYWSSTESETDASMAYFVRFGKFLVEPIAKSSTTRYARCVKVFGNYTYGPEPEVPEAGEDPDPDQPGGDNPGGGQPEPDQPGGETPGGSASVAVGDPWKEGNATVGIVYWVAEDGTSAKIVSLSRTSTTIAWSTVGGEYLGAGSKSDGAANTAALKASSQADAIPMLDFCESLGEGWYWPACLELNKAYLVKDAVDAALSANGGTPFGTDQYWSSTEFEEAPKYASHVRFDRDYVGAAGDEINKTGSTKRYGRAVKQVAL